MIKILLSLLLILPSALIAQVQFAKGADIGWLSEMEASGRKFYNSSGQAQDLLDILKNKGVNSIRLRVWHTPTGGWCGKEDVVKQAVRAKNKGFRIMVDFHYSDSWADPGQQNKPAAWTSYSFSQLTQAVKDHTVDVLTTLKNNGVTPEWVQVGNETNNGMLWDDGKASANMKNFATLVTSGYDGVKSVFPNAKVIVHLSNGFDNGLFRWMFDGLKSNSAKWDVIGLSIYPDQSASSTSWQTIDPQCLSNMNDMVSRYGKEVMVAEIGIDWIDPQVAFDFVSDILKKTRSVSGGKGLGVFYWEPESYYGWSGYHKGTFDDTGKPTKALDAFLEGITTDLASMGALDNSVLAYPNPFVSSLTIKLKGDFEYQVVDQMGHEIETGVASDQVFILEDGTAGIYTVKVTSGGTNTFLKVIKK